MIGEKIKGGWELKRQQVRQQMWRGKDGESMKYDSNRKEIKDRGRRRGKREQQASTREKGWWME